MNYIYIYMASKQDTPITSTTTTPTATAVPAVVATAVPASRVFLPSICDDRTRHLVLEQATSPAVACSMERRLVRAVARDGRQGPASLSLTGFTCGGNSLRVHDINHRDGTLTYRPPALFNSAHQRVLGQEEAWFKPSTGIDTARAKFTRERNGNKNFILQMAQTFMQWNILGNDITHDIDEDKPSDRCRDILFQRWIKQLSTIHPALRDTYLNWLSNFFDLFLDRGFWGALNGTILTFAQYVQGGGPEMVEAHPGYVSGATKSLGDIKDALTNGLTRVMARNGRGFVSFQTGDDPGFQIRTELEKATAAAAMDIATHTTIIHRGAAAMIAIGAESFSPQNALYLGTLRTRYGIDAAKRQVHIDTPAVVSINNKTHGNMGDAAPKKPIPGQNLRRQLPTRNTKLIGEVAPGTRVLLQNEFESGGIPTRRNKLVLTSRGGSTNPTSIFAHVEKLLQETGKSVVKFSKKDILALAPVGSERKATIVENCAAMAKADKDLLSATQPRKVKARDRAKTTNKIKEEADRLQAQIESIQRARGLGSMSAPLPVLSEAAKTAYQQKDKHRPENAKRQEMRQYVMATVRHANAPNIEQVPKSTSLGGIFPSLSTITPGDYWFFVQVTKESYGHYSITYNRNGQPVTYYPTGRIPPNIVEQMIRSKNGVRYLPLATVLILDERIRTHIATQVYDDLAKSADGQVFIKAILDSLRQNPETILKIFANHKEAFFTPLTHQKQHAHTAPSTKYKHHGGITTTWHLASIANELFDSSGGKFLKENLEKSKMEERIGQLLKATPEHLVLKILMAIMTLQQEEEDRIGVRDLSDQPEDRGGGESKSGQPKHSSQCNDDNIGDFIYNGVSRYLLENQETLKTHGISKEEQKLIHDHILSILKNLLLDFTSIQIWLLLFQKTIKIILKMI